ncbi:MAG: hypothetical protein K2Y08_00055 [Alphaproteobacteria bacterium]|nr:hypothetical protein [Alphaproteobacteria bacterium]
MLRLSIIMGIILSTLTFHPLKAFNDEVDDTPISLMTVTALFKASETVSLDSLRDKLTATGKMGPNGVGFLININGILVEVARLYTNEFELNEDWHKQLRREKGRHEKLSKFKRTHENLMKKLDILSMSGSGSLLSTYYASLTSAKDEVTAKLGIGFLALKHKKDKGILLEIFKGIPIEERRARFNTLLFETTPQLTSSSNHQAHQTLRTLREEIMGVPFDPSKIGLLDILKSLDIKSLFEEE